MTQHTMQPNTILAAGMIAGRAQEQGYDTHIMNTGNPETLMVTVSDPAREDMHVCTVNVAPLGKGVSLWSQGSSIYPGAADRLTAGIDGMVMATCYSVEFTYTPWNAS